MFTDYFRCLECREYFRITTSSSGNELKYNIEHLICPRCGGYNIDYATDKQVKELNK